MIRLATIVFVLVFVATLRHTAAQPLTLPLPSGHDDTATINATLAKAGPRGVYAPGGHIWKHNGVVNVAGTCLYGDGDSSVFQATDTNRSWANLAIELSGTNPCLHDIATTTTWTGPRMSDPQSDAVHVVNATNFRVEHVTISGSSSGGIFLENSGPGVVRENRVVNTLADAIGVYSESHDVEVSSNYVENSGDDAISCVSYANEPKQATRVRIFGNQIHGGEARGIAVVGCTRVVVFGNVLANIRDSCLMAITDTGWKSKPVAHVQFFGNICDNTTAVASKYPAAIWFSGPHANDITADHNMLTNIPVPCVKADPEVTNATEHNTSCNQ